MKASFVTFVVKDKLLKLAQPLGQSYKFLFLSVWDFWQSDAIISYPTGLKTLVKLVVV
jgi:hypothetical protein